MKTIRQWAEELPPNIKERFYSNMEFQGKMDRFNDNHDSFEDAILSSFRWNKAPEESGYWGLVSEGEFDEAENLLEKSVSYISDFKNTLEKLESLLKLGATKSGRYRGQWKEDRSPTYHLEKALGHIVKATESAPTAIDEDTGDSHLINAIARLMIAHEQECLLKEAN